MCEGWTVRRCDQSLCGVSDFMFDVLQACGSHEDEAACTVYGLTRLCGGRWLQPACKLESKTEVR